MITTKDHATQFLMTKTTLTELPLSYQCHKFQVLLKDIRTGSYVPGRVIPIKRFCVYGKKFGRPVKYTPVVGEWYVSDRFKSIGCMSFTTETWAKIKAAATVARKIARAKSKAKA